jgi:hypothetical protein
MQKLWRRKIIQITVVAETWLLDAGREIPE